MVRLAAALNVLGSDDIYPSPRLQNLMVRNNVFEIDRELCPTIAPFDAAFVNAAAGDDTILAGARCSYRSR